MKKSPGRTLTLLAATSIFRTEMLMVLDGPSDQISFTYFMMRLTKVFLPSYCNRHDISIDNMLIIYDNACKIKCFLNNFPLSFTYFGFSRMVFKTTTISYFNNPALHTRI